MTPGLGPAEVGEVEHGELGCAIGVADDELEQEAVELGFGERVGAFVLDGVLGGEDEEGVGQVDGLVADGDLTLLHGFEQGALDLGGRCD